MLHSRRRYRQTPRRQCRRRSRRRLHQSINEVRAIRRRERQRWHVSSHPPLPIRTLSLSPRQRRVQLQRFSPPTRTLPILLHNHATRSSASRQPRKLTFRLNKPLRLNRPQRQPPPPQPLHHYTSTLEACHRRPPHLQYQRRLSSPPPLQYPQYQRWQRLRQHYHQSVSHLPADKPPLIKRRFEFYSLECRARFRCWVRPVATRYRTCRHFNNNSNKSLRIMERMEALVDSSMESRSRPAPRWDHSSPVPRCWLKCHK